MYKTHADGTPERRGTASPNGNMMCMDVMGNALMACVGIRFLFTRAMRITLSFASNARCRGLGVLHLRPMALGCIVGFTLHLGNALPVTFVGHAGRELLHHLVLVVHGLGGRAGRRGVLNRGARLRRGILSRG